MRQAQQLGFEGMEVDSGPKSMVVGLVICGVEFFDVRSPGVSEFHDNLKSALKLEDANEAEG